MKAAKMKERPRKPETATASGGIVTTYTVLLLLPLLSAAVAHPPSGVDQASLADREPDQSYNAQEEAFMHTPPGFDKPGKPAVAKEPGTATLRVTIVDAATGKPTFCRVNVVGPDGNYYQPADHPLGPWSRHKFDFRETYSPSRYYGWFFYTNGDFQVTVPAGSSRIEVWKGYEYRPLKRTVQLAADSSRVELRLTRTVSMHALGYYSGDTHIHLNRRNEEDDQRSLDLMAAEDLQYGFLLCTNDTGSYSGRMDRQMWPQQRGFGAASVRKRGRYGIVSGQEYRANTYGHICLLMHDRLVLEGLTVDPNNWPVFGLVGRDTRRLGGYAFHAHGGYSQEIYADYVQRVTDGVELLQMAHYRGIGLKGWYRILNVGFRFPALAGSDFPYGRALGDCRNYVYAANRPDFAGWTRSAAEGRSFFTTGPFLLLEVDGRRPGETIELAGNKAHRLAVRGRVRSEITPVTRLDLIVNGQTVKRSSVPDGSRQGRWHELRHELTVDGSCWIAARAHSISPTGRPDAEAHTNPVYVDVDGNKPYNADDLNWLLARLDERIALLTQRSFPEKTEALTFFQESRRGLLVIRKRQGQAKADATHSR